MCVFFLLNISQYHAASGEISLIDRLVVNQLYLVHRAALSNTVGTGHISLFKFKFELIKMK